MSRLIAFVLRDGRQDVVSHETCQNTTCIITCYFLSRRCEMHGGTLRGSYQSRVHSFNLLMPEAQAYKLHPMDTDVASVGLSWGLVATWTINSLAARIQE